MPTWFNICTQIDNEGERGRERGGGSRQYFPPTAYQGSVDGKTERRGERMAGRAVMREREGPMGGRRSERDGPLIGLHNIDSITGEFFGALRASSTLARRSAAREKERKGKNRKRER